MEFGWAPEERDYRRDLRKFVEAEVPKEWIENPRQRPVVTPDDRRRTLSFNHKLASRGWLTSHWPREYGGSEASAWQHLITGEELWSVGEPRGPQYMNVNWIGPAIMRYGSPEQKEYHLREISRGSVFWCQGFSEPDAGSDLASLRTAAIREGDTYVINGQKIWTSHCQVADWCVLLARTARGEDPRAGISIFLIPMTTPGIEVRRIPNYVEVGSLHEVFFTDVQVPVSNRLGEENQGWQIVRDALKYERVGAARWERASRTLDAVASWAKHEGRLDDPALLRRLGEAKAACEVARLLAYRVIDARAKGISTGGMASVSRVATARADRLVGDAAMEAYGTRGLIAGSAPDAFWWQALAAGVAGGSYEIQLNLISHQAMQLPAR